MRAAYPPVAVVRPPRTGPAPVHPTGAGRLAGQPEWRRDGSPGAPRPARRRRPRRAARIPPPVERRASRPADGRPAGPSARPAAARARATAGRRPPRRAGPRRPNAGSRRQPARGSGRAGARRRGSDSCGIPAGATSTSAASRTSGPPATGPGRPPCTPECARSTATSVWHSRSYDSPQGEFAQSSADTVAATRSIPEPISVARNSRNATVKAGGRAASGPGLRRGWVSPPRAARRPEAVEHLDGVPPVGPVHLGGSVFVERLCGGQPRPAE